LRATEARRLVLPGRKPIAEALLRYLNVFDSSSFTGRLIIQKTVYLLQVFGFALGYRFSWYIYGPYSPDLTRDVMETGAGAEPLAFNKLRLTEQANNRLKEFRAFVDPVGGDPLQLE